MSRVPYFTAYVETEVDIAPDELERAGWVYTGEPGKPPPEKQDIGDAVRGWHDDEHRGAWRFCDERPCIDIRELYLRSGATLPEAMVPLP